MKLTGWEIVKNASIGILGGSSGYGSFCIGYFLYRHALPPIIWDTAGFVIIVNLVLAWLLGFRWFLNRKNSKTLTTKGGE